MTKKTIAIFVALATVVAGFLVLDSIYGLTGGFGRVVDGLIARNVEARGGADAWRNVDSLRMTGRMDLGQGILRVIEDVYVKLNPELDNRNGILIKD